MGSSGAQRARRPVAGSWVTAANLTATGTATVESAVMSVTIPVGISAWVLEVQFTHVRAAGTGTTDAWVKVAEYQGDVTVADAAAAAVFYGGRHTVGSSVRSKTVRLSSSVLQAQGDAASDVINVYIRANGSAADTELLVSNIQARLIYTPL
jgi:hypothetical protein